MSVSRRMDKYIAIYLINGILYTTMRMNKVPQHAAMLGSFTNSNDEWNNARPRKYEYIPSDSIFLIFKHAKVS